MPDSQSNIIIYNTLDGKASVALYAVDGKIWLNQMQMAELFATSKQSISYHISNILKEGELKTDSVVIKTLYIIFHLSDRNIFQEKLWCNPTIIFVFL